MSFKSRLFACGTVALATVASPVLADQNDSARWSTVGPWSIMVDRTLGNGCFMLGTYTTSNTILRVGIANNSHSSYFVIVNPAWASLEVGKVYPVVGELDGQQANWHATARKLGTLTVLSVDFSEPSPDEVLSVFGRTVGFKLHYQGQVIANLRLNGTAAAAAEVVNCNHQMLNASAAPKSDPFSAPAPKTTMQHDPFAA
jgi:hypothetical protein